MTPKIVTRLANIAAKLAGSDKYDPTIEPVTAFEYYLDKGVDKILAIKGVPAAEAGDAGKVLTVSNMGMPVWEGLLVITASLDGNWTGATWNAVKNSVQNGKVISVIVAGFNITIYAMFNLVFSNTETNEELAISYPMMLNGEHSYVTISSNGEFIIKPI